MKGLAKKITLAMLVVVFVVGIVMLFLPHLQMDRYMTFVKAFAYIYTPLIASIGINSGIEKWKENVGKDQSLV